MRKKILIIHNPAAGGAHRRRLEKLSTGLRQQGAEPELRPTKGPGDATRQARLAMAEDWDLVIAAGGDGTAREVANGMDTNCPMGFFPVGTANVLGHELALPRNIAALAAIYLEGEARPLILPRINGERFILMASAGFDAWAVASVLPNRKKRLGKLAYLMAGISLLTRWPPMAYQVVIDGREYDASGVLVLNARHYAGAYKISDKAAMTNDHLQVLLLQRQGRWASLRYALSTFLGRLHKRRDVQEISGRDIYISGPPGSPVQVDGDILGDLPVTIKKDDQPIRMVVPLKS